MALHRVQKQKTADFSGTWRLVRQFNMKEFLQTLDQSYVVKDDAGMHMTSMEAEFSKFYGSIEDGPHGILSDLLEERPLLSRFTV